MTIAEKREVFSTMIENLDISFDTDSAIELIEGLDENQDFSFEVDGGEYRLIPESDIDEIMQEELTSDLYTLGCCSDWFIASMTDLSTEEVTRAQKAESFEVLGALMAKDIEAVQSEVVGHDGYGPHFSHYDFSEWETAGWYIFRTN